MTVWELEHRMSAAELAEWMAYYQLEPFGPLRDDLRAGSIAAMLANTIPREPGARPFKPEDFFPELQTSAKPREQQSREEQIAALKMWAIVENAEGV